jgi:uncharacterized protein (TIGR04222 family)
METPIGILDLPGPEFLTLYAVLAVVALVASLVLRRALRGPGGRTGDGDALRLHPLEVACLAGGPRLAVNTAVASLFQRGLIRLSGDTRPTLEPARPAGGAGDDAPLHPFETGILHLIRHSPPQTIRTVHRAAPLHAVAGEPTRAGLLLSGPARAAVGAASVVPLAAVLVLGLLKIGVGVARDRPVAFLVIFCVATLVAVVILLATTPRRTRAGDAALDRIRRQHAALRPTAFSAPGSLAPAEFALAVGLFGVGVLAAEPALADLRRAIVPPNQGGTSSCGGSSCSSGDGGGSSCGGGGGCGGCGGGGD